MNHLSLLITLSAAGAALAWPAASLLRCQHRHEIFDRYPDGRPALRCERCLRLRPNILAAEQPSYHRTQAAAPPPATGIARTWAEIDAPLHQPAPVEAPITDEDLFDLLPAGVLLERRSSSPTLTSATHPDSVN